MLPFLPFLSFPALSFLRPVLSSCLSPSNMGGKKQERKHEEMEKGRKEDRAVRKPVITDSISRRYHPNPPKIWAVSNPIHFPFPGAPKMKMKMNYPRQLIKMKMGNESDFRRDKI